MKSMVGSTTQPNRLMWVSELWPVMNAVASGKLSSDVRKSGYSLDWNLLGIVAQKEATMNPLKLTGEEYDAKLKKALANLDGVSIFSAMAFDASKTVMIIFKMDSNELWLAEQNMKDIVRALQTIGTDGKRVRLAAKMMNGLTGLTMTLSEQAVKDFDASVDVVEWAAIAEEYNVAKGLQ